MTTDRYSDSAADTAPDRWDAGARQMLADQLGIPATEAQAVWESAPEATKRLMKSRARSVWSAIQAIAMDPAEAEADRRLIASAHDMLGALRSLVRSRDESFTRHPSMEAWEWARRAIATATGSQP